MHFDLADDKEALRAMAADFLARECDLDFARRHDEAGSFPADLYRKLGELGWLGIPFAAEDGGSDGDALDEAIILEQLGRAMGPLASAFLISVLTCGKTIRDLATPAQRERWLPDLITGESMLAFALTEPQAGSDAAALRTRAIQAGQGWTLSGQKIFCTGATLARHLLVMARTDSDSAAARGTISMFVVDTDLPGLSIAPIPKLGLHPYPSCMIFFDDVRLPAEALLGQRDQGWPHLTTSLNRERLAISAMCTGMAQAALDVARRYVTERHQFGRPLADFEAIRRHIADMTAAVEGARALMMRAAWLEASGMPSTRAASMAKICSTEAAVDVARRGMQVLGGYSYTMEYPMQRFLRDALIHPIAGGSNEIQRNIIARDLELGLAREPETQDRRAGRPLAPQLADGPTRLDLTAAERQLVREWRTLAADFAPVATAAWTRQGWIPRAVVGAMPHPHPHPRRTGPAWSPEPGEAISIMESARLHGGAPELLVGAMLTRFLAGTPGAAGSPGAGPPLPAARLIVPGWTSDGPQPLSLICARSGSDLAVSGVGSALAADCSADRAWVIAALADGEPGSGCVAELALSLRQETGSSGGRDDGYQVLTDHPPCRITEPDVRGAAIARILSPGEVAAFRDLLRTGAACVMVGLIDTFSAAITAHAQQRAAASSDRWAAQAAKHRGVGIALARDTARLHIFHALDAFSDPDARAMFSALALATSAQGLDEAIADRRRMAYLDGDDHVLAAVSLASAQHGFWLDLAGGPGALSEAISDSSLGQRTPVRADLRLPHGARSAALAQSLVR